MEPERHRPLGRPGERLRRRRADGRPARSSSSASPSSASATACSSSRTCSAARSSGRARASTATRASSSRSPRASSTASPSARRSTCGCRHGDRIVALPPGFQTIGVSGNTPFCAVGNAAQAHLRRAVPPRGRPHAARRRHPRGLPLRRRRPRADVDAGLVHRGGHGRRAREGRPDRPRHLRPLGGVDSSVAAVLCHKALGDRLTCIFVDNGLLRAGRGRAGRLDVPRELPPQPRRRRRARRASSRRSPA